MSPAQAQSSLSPRPTPKNALVLGCTGMVGRSWMQLLKELNIPCVGLSRPKFDLLNSDSIDRCLKNPPELVINASAWTDVDGAEAQEDLATQANAHAVARIAQHCADAGSTLLTYSTDYVFSGNANTPYATNQTIDPINAYGRSKARGEELLAQSNANTILIRTSWVYAPWGTNFVRTIDALAASRDELSVVNDQQGRPTNAIELAKNSLKLYLAGALDTWHLTDAGECTWFDFASQLIAHQNHTCTTSPCSSDKFPRPARRPAYSTLDIEPTINLIGPLEHWKSGLSSVLKQIKTDSTNQ